MLQDLDSLKLHNVNVAEHAVMLIVQAIWQGLCIYGVIVVDLWNDTS